MQKIHGLAADLKRDTLEGKEKKKSARAAMEIRQTPGSS